MEGRKDFAIGSFTVREDVALPIFIEENRKLSPEDITPENIIKGMIKVLTDDPDNEYLDYYREFIFAVKPDINESLSRIAFEAEKNEHFDDAIELFKVLYILSNKSREQILNLAICHDEYSQYQFDQGLEIEAEKNEEDAFQFYKEIESFDEKNDRELFYLGRFYLLKENYDKAAEYFREFVEITDDDERKKEVTGLLNDIFKGGFTDDDYNTAMELIQADKDSEAFEFIEKFIAKYPGSWHAHYARGLAFRKLGNYTEALTAFETALKFNPESHDIFNEIGLCYTALNIYHKAEMYFYRALKNNAEDLNVMYNLALLSLKRGNSDEALKYARIILEYNKDDMQAKKLIEEIENQKK